MRRREFMRWAVGAAIWPMAARAQSSARQIAMLVPAAEDDPMSRAVVTAFEQGLAERGWRNGGDIHIDYRWAVDSVDKTKAAIAELQARPPDVVLASTSRTL